MVKLLALIFMLGNAQASTLVSIINDEGQAMSKLFDTEAEADTYIANTKSKWGKLAGWRPDNCAGQVATRVNEYGYTEYNCPDDFTATKSDNTAAIATQDALIQIKKDMSFGSSLYANIRLLNAGKDKATRDAMRATFSTIRDALLDGDICSAKVDIAAIVPDANITAGNITTVTAMIDAYKVCI